jgi:hypothetical protein
LKINPVQSLGVQLDHISIRVCDVDLWLLGKILGLGAVGDAASRQMFQRIAIVPHSERKVPVTRVNHAWISMRCPARVSDEMKLTVTGLVPGPGKVECRSSDLR